MSYPQSEQRYTLEEYYALDKASDRRWEYWDGEIICMSGGSKEHAIIQGNVLKHLSNRLKEHCRAFSADMAVKTKTQAGYVYPDVSAGH
jgi:Uma2 family endonuclease